MFWLLCRFWLFGDKGVRDFLPHGAYDDLTPNDVFEIT